jgi:hypothetical protein
MARRAENSHLVWQGIVSLPIPAFPEMMQKDPLINTPFWKPVWHAV